MTAKKLRTFHTTSAQHIINMLAQAGYEDVVVTNYFEDAFRAELGKLGIDEDIGELALLGPGTQCCFEAELTDEEYALVRLKFFQ